MYCASVDNQSDKPENPFGPTQILQLIVVKQRPTHLKKEPYLDKQCEAL